MEENNNDKEGEIINNPDDISLENDTIKISNEAVATYAGIAASEVSGVYGMSGTFAGFTEAISGKKNYSKGIKVDIENKTAKIDVNIIVEYGARIPDVAFEIQTRVKSAVENMTGLKVPEVNVHVQGVHAMTDKEKEEQVKENAIEVDSENNNENTDNTNE